MQGLNYWEQLGELKLYSLEHRQERYVAIYIWRILEGHVPNFDMTPVSKTWQRVPRPQSVRHSLIIYSESSLLFSTYKGSEYLQFSAAVCQKYYWLQRGDL